MRTIKVFFEDGDWLITRINGTEAEIAAYYLGNTFNLGSVEDRMVRCSAIMFLR